MTPTPTTVTVEQEGRWSDAAMLRRIADDHERLAPNAYHSADTLREIADRIATASSQVTVLREALKRILAV